MKQYFAMMAALALAFTAGAMDLKLQNDDFRLKDGKLTGWSATGLNAETGTAYQSVALPDEDDEFALELTTQKPCNWFAVYQSVPLATLPKLGANQYYEFELEFKHKADNVTGSGTFATLAFFDGSGKRLTYMDTTKYRGTFDWQKRKFTVKFDAIPAGAASFGVMFYLGKGTGTAWFADPELEVEVRNQ